jgi:hypothetical protein
VLRGCDKHLPPSKQKAKEGKILDQVFVEVASSYSTDVRKSHVASSPKRRREEQEEDNERGGNDFSLLERGGGNEEEEDSGSEAATDQQDPSGGGRSRSPDRRDGPGDGPPLPAQARQDSDTPDVELFVSPYGMCSERLGQSSIVATANGCRKLGGLARNSSALDMEEGVCLLDLCVKGMYSIYPPGVCRDPVSSVKLKMTRGDCKEKRGNVTELVVSSNYSEMIHCVMDMCYNIGGLCFRPAGYCNTQVQMPHTMARECRQLFGNLDPYMDGTRWSDDCKLDICQVMVGVRVEVDTRTVPEAVTQSGAQFQFKVLGKWGEVIELADQAKKAEKLKKDIKLEAWPEAMSILAKGHDMYGFKEIRLMYSNVFIRLLADFPVAGQSNDEPNPLSQYWVGIAADPNAGGWDSGQWVPQQPPPGSGDAPAFVEVQVPDVTHMWRSFGQDYACRTSETDEGQADRKAPLVFNAKDYTDCQALCAESDHCYGIEFEDVQGRCQLWQEEIIRVADMIGHECYMLWQDPKLATPTKKPKIPFFRMLRSGSDCLDYDPNPDMPKDQVFVHACSSSLTQQWHLQNGVFFSRMEPFRCLIFNETENRLDTANCSRKEFSPLNRVDSSSTMPLFPGNMPGNMTFGNAFKAFVKPPDTDWDLVGVRFKLKEQDRCMKADLYSKRVNMVECHENDNGQDWSWVQSAEWTQEDS